MELLVGKGVEVVWPAAGAWYKAVVQAYSAQSGKHFLVYANGEVEWLALNSGYYQWQLIEQSVELKARAHPLHLPHRPPLPPTSLPSAPAHPSLHTLPWPLVSPLLASRRRCALSWPLPIENSSS